MGQILKAANDNLPLNIDGTMVVPCNLIPSFRMHHAIENKKDHNILIRSYGGLGDQVCAEPAIRYALNHFDKCDISVESLNPSLFQHLPLKGNFNEKDLSKEARSSYNCFQSMYEPDHLNWEFFRHIDMHCVDFPSVNMWRCQLPIQDRTIRLVPGAEQSYIATQIRDNDVVIHPGLNWQSKTLPKDFWDKVLSRLIEGGARPVLIGATAQFGDQFRSTIGVDTHGVLDLRNSLQVMETVAVLQKAKVVLTNDSAPLHLAASGKAWIGFVSTVKHPDHITHWRSDMDGEVKFGWRMKNHSSGGMWETMNLNPNNMKEVYFNKVDDYLLRSWLPNPEEYADWALGCLNAV